GVKAPARVWRAVFAGALAYDDGAQLGRIGAPTLIIWGEHDAYFPRAAQETLRSSIPDARLAIYPDTGHCPNWERPEQLAPHLAALVEGTPPPTPPPSSRRRPPPGSWPIVDRARRRSLPAEARDRSLRAYAELAAPKRRTVDR